MNQSEDDTEGTTFWPMPHRPAAGTPLPLGQQLQAIGLASYMARRRGTAPSAQLCDAIELLRGMTEAPQ